MTTAAPPIPIVKTIVLELSRLEAHPLNPRAKLSAAGVAGLADLIAAQGLLSPLLVRALPDDRFQVLDGNRRMLALETLKVDRASAIVRVLDDAEAIAVMLSANEEREDVDPFREAKAVEALIAADGSVKHAAARLGKPVRWVAQRRSLLSLSPCWDAMRKDEPLSLWPAAAWEIVARLSPEAQEVLQREASTSLRYLFDSPAADLHALEEAVKERLRVIGKAPFDPDDAKLLRGVPSCGVCPKTSQSVPGLFDDGNPTDLASAVCRDGGCWAKKAAATVRAKVAEVRAREGLADAPIVLRAGAKASGAGRALQQYRWEESKKDAKDAAPVVIVGPTGGVTLGYAKIKRDDRRLGPDKPAGKVESPAELLARLEGNREDDVAKKFRELLVEAAVERRTDPPAAVAVLACALQFGLGDSYDLTEKTQALSERTVAGVIEGRGSTETLCTVVWARVVEVLKREGVYRDPDDDEADQALLLAVLKLDRAPLMVRAERDVAVSKELAQARAAKAGPPLEVRPPGHLATPAKAKNAALAERVRGILKTKKKAKARR